MKDLASLSHIFASLSSETPHFLARLCRLLTLTEKTI